MKIIGALIVAGAIVLAIGPQAIAAGWNGAARGGAYGEAVILPADLERHIPLICLDSNPTEAAGRHRSDFEEIECRPNDRDIRA